MLLKNKYEYPNRLHGSYFQEMDITTLLYHVFVPWQGFISELKKESILQEK